MKISGDCARLGHHSSRKPLTKDPFTHSTRHGYVSGLGLILSTVSFPDADKYKQQRADKDNQV